MNSEQIGFSTAGPSGETDSLTRRAAGKVASQPPYFRPTGSCNRNPSVYQNRQTLPLRLGKRAKRSIAPTTWWSVILQRMKDGPSPGVTRVPHATYDSRLWRAFDVSH